MLMLRLAQSLLVVGVTLGSWSTPHMQLEDSLVRTFNRIMSFFRSLTFFSDVGSCWCVGVLGAGLGGGQGRLQGEHGLIIDAMNSARVVLADGSIVTVSATQHADLWWGLRGAGQNFGIVIDADMTTQPLVEGGTNYDVEMDFSIDKIEVAMELMNKQIDQLIPALAVDLIFGADTKTLKVHHDISLFQDAANNVPAHFPHQLRLRRSPI